MENLKKYQSGAVFYLQYITTYKIVLKMSQLVHINAQQKSNKEKRKKKKEINKKKKEIKNKTKHDK